MNKISLNKNEIYDYQKNREPYLFLDFATEIIPGKSAKGYKDLKKDEWFFKVHWPNDPNMPGMLQIEALVQMSALSILSLPGNKGKIEIDIPNNPKLHLTADMMEVDQNEKLITLLEGKNSSKEKFTTDTMIYEQIVKLILLKNCDFKFNCNSFKTKLICSVTGNEKATNGVRVSV